MREKELESQVNDMIGTALGVGFITPQQLLSCGIIFMLCLPIIIISPIKGILSFACIYGGWWVLTGNDPTFFLESMKKPNRYLSVEPELEISKGGIPRPKRPKRLVTQYKIKGKKVPYHHIESKYKLLTYGQIELGGVEVGFKLLRQGPRVMFIFGWTIEGHSPSMTPGESDSVIEACTNALNQMPQGVDLKIYEELDKDCEEYLKMQASLLVSKKLDPLSSASIKSRGKRARELKESGRLLKHTITIYAKYRMVLGGEYAVTKNWLEEMLSLTQPLVGAIKGQDFDSRRAWNKVIRYAYNYAYKRVNFLLSDNKGGFGVKAETMTVKDMYRKDYLSLHELTKQNPEVPPVPQYVVYGETGLIDPIINQWGTHILGSLFQPQGGISAVPQFDRDKMYYPVKNKYGGFIRIGQISQFPKDRESVSLGYLKYVWNILAGTTAGIYDCRVITEITADRTGFEIVNLDRTISSTIKREAEAAKKQTVDVMATITREKAVEARGLLADKNIPYWVSMGIWLYRDTPEELEQDLDNLAGQITGAAVETEQNCTEDIWLQSANYEWEAFLTKPNHRRQKYISYQALPSIPLVKIRELDKKGVMFVTRELSTPIYIDIADQKNHTAIVAKSGTGKSNVIVDILLEYIVRGYLAVLFDFPRPDGSSTYTILVPLLQKLGFKAAYHNVRRSRINIIELPDLRHIKDPQKKQEVWEQVFDNHVRLLQTLVMGTVQNPDREMIVASLLTDCYRHFLDAPHIKARYDEAIAGGFGSDAYSKMPILEDFVEYAEKWFGELIDSKQGRISILVNDTIDVIITQLRGILKTALGRSINGISSFDTRVDILVIGLTQVSDSADSLIYAMSGLNVLYRAAFNAKRSLLGIDEGTVLYKFPAFARETGIIPVHGRKWSCNFLIAAQEIATILNSCSGGEIFKNLDNILGGHIETTAIEEMTGLEVGFRREIYERYTSMSYLPNKTLLQSYWYLRRGDEHIEVTHPACEMVLGLGATDEQEDKARKRVMSQFQNKVEAIKEFSRLNANAKRQGLPMQSIYPEVVLDEEEQNQVA